VGDCTEEMRIRIAEVNPDSRGSVTLAYVTEFLFDDTERFVPVDLLEDRRAVVVDTSTHERLAESVRVFMQLLERGPLRADEARREDIILIAANALHHPVSHLNLQATGGLAQRTRTKDGSISRGRLSHRLNRVR
jgi:hypothetical protein